MLGGLAMAVLQGILETLGVLAMSVVIAGKEIKWERLLPVSLLVSLITYLVKSFQTHMGLNTIVGLTILLLFLWKRYELKLLSAFTGMIVSFLILGLLEIAFNIVFFQVIELNQVLYENTPMLWSLIGIPQGLVLNLLAFIISRVKIKKRQKDYC